MSNKHHCDFFGKRRYYYQDEVLMMDVSCSECGEVVYSEILVTKDNKMKTQNDNHRILNLSGGATAISGLFGSAETIMKVRHYNPTVITGISAGALLAVPLAMGKYSEAKEMVLNFNLKTIFSKSPLRKNGKLSLCALRNIIQGKHYLGEMGNLITTFERLITPEDWENFRHGDFPDVYVGIVNFKYGSSTFANLKTWSYKMAVEAIIASASIPVFTPGVMIGEWEYYDGGLRDHIISSQIIDKYSDIERVVSIYSRPKDYHSVDMDATKNIISVIERTIEIMNIEISKNDEYQEEHNCFHREIPLSKVYLPRVMKHMWDTNPERIQKLYDIGKQKGMEVEI